MIDLEKLTADLRSFLKEHNYRLYQLSYKKQKTDYILTVEIDDHLDLNGIAKVSEIVSDFLDEGNYFEDPYLLDICTVGLERQLKSHQDIVDHVGEYVHVKFKQEINGKKTIEGTLKEVSDDSLVIAYADKNIHKQLTLKEADIKMIRLAIKF